MPPFPPPHIALPAELRSLLPRSASFSSSLSELDSIKRSLQASTSPESHPVFRLFRRQTQYFGLIPPSYQTNGLTPGAIVGIVLGSVAGFLLIIILLWNLFGGGGFGGSSRNITGEEEIVVRRRSRSPHRSHRSRHSRSDREIIREIREVSRSPRRPSRTIVEERVDRVRERTPPRPRSSGGGIIVEERIETSRPPHHRRVEGDDIVEVIEEQSVSTEPPRRHRSRRSSGYRY